MLELTDSNGLITDLITSEKPFSVSRLGIGEILLFDKVINNKQNIILKNNVKYVKRKHKVIIW